MLTRPAHALVLASTGLLTLGLATGNPVLLGLVAVPLAAFILGVLPALPRPIDAAVSVAARGRTGDVIDVAVSVNADGPAGLLAVHVPLPAEFELVHGSNAHVLHKRRGPVTLDLQLTVRAAKRGRYEIGTVDVAPIALAGLRAQAPVVLGETARLEVHPRVVPVRRLRSLRGTAATVAPDEDVAALGLRTTDFKEIREYRWGDPPRSVNWRATARHAGATALPLVNEYEVEGRKSVWFMLDAGRHMVVGTSVENGLEVAISAVSGLALSYLDRGYKVGLYAYNTSGVVPLYPDVGTKQFLKVQRVLSRLEPGAGREGPVQAVARCRSWLIGSSPLVVFVTRTEVATEHLEDAVRQVQALTPGRRQPVLVLEPLAFHLVPGTETERDTARLMAQLARPRHQRLRKLGAIVIAWDPEREPLERLLFRGVGR